MSWDPFDMQDAEERRCGRSTIACAIADAWAEWLEYAGVDRGDMPSVTDQRITVDLAKLLNTLEAVTRESPLRKVRS